MHLQVDRNMTISESFYKEIMEYINNLKWLDSVLKRDSKHFVDKEENNNEKDKDKCENQKHLNGRKQHKSTSDVTVHRNSSTLEKIRHKRYSASLTLKEIRKSISMLSLAESVEPGKVPVKTPVKIEEKQIEIKPKNKLPLTATKSDINNYSNVRCIFCRKINNDIQKKVQSQHKGTWLCSIVKTDVSTSALIKSAHKSTENLAYLSTENLAYKTTNDSSIVTNKLEKAAHNTDSESSQNRTQLDNSRQNNYPLHEAALTGDCDKVLELLESGFNVWQANDENLLALDVASTFRVSRILLDATKFFSRNVYETNNLLDTNLLCHEL